MKFMTVKFIIVSMICVFLTAGTGAWAEERYSEWGGGDEKYDALVERLQELIDAAEKSRAADPRLLRDLRDAIAQHTAAAPEAEPEPALPQQTLVHDILVTATLPAIRPGQWSKGDSASIRDWV